MSLTEGLMEHVSKAVSILQTLEEEIPRYEERVLAVGPKLKELESIEARILSVQKEHERWVKELEGAKKDYDEFMSRRPVR